MLAPSDTITKITPVEICALLPRRMAALGLDADTVARFDPDTFGGLRRLCATCKYHEWCGWDLTQDYANPAWQEYCPNCAMLRNSTMSGHTTDLAREIEAVWLRDAFSGAVGALAVVVLLILFS